MTGAAGLASGSAGRNVLGQHGHPRRHLASLIWPRSRFDNMRIVQSAMNLGDPQQRVNRALHSYRFSTRHPGRAAGLIRDLNRTLEKFLTRKFSCQTKIPRLRRTTSCCTARGMTGGEWSAYS